MSEGVVSATVEEAGKHPWWIAGGVAGLVILLWLLSGKKAPQAQQFTYSYGPSDAQIQAGTAAQIAQSTNQANVGIAHEQAATAQSYFGYLATANASNNATLANVTQTEGNVALGKAQISGNVALGVAQIGSNTAFNNASFGYATAVNNNTNATFQTQINASRDLGVAQIGSNTAITRDQINANTLVTRDQINASTLVTRDQIAADTSRIANAAANTLATTRAGYAYQLDNYQIFQTGVERPANGSAIVPSYLPV